MSDNTRDESAERQAPQQAGGAEPLSAEIRNMAVLCHILGLVGIIGPLLVWFLTREKHKFIDDCGKEAVNYQISMTIYFMIAGVLCVILIGIPLLLALWITNIVLVIIAALKASKGERYRYPIALRFIS